MRLLYVGTTEPHKNLQVVLHGMEKVRRSLSEATLFMTCPLDHPLCRQDGIVGLGYLNRAELRQAYELATCLIQPSLVETVGLPLIEAMLMQVPVLVADRSYAHDVCQTVAWYFDPHSLEDFSQKVAALLHSKEARDQLIQDGSHLVQELQANNPYAQMLDVIAQVVPANP